jgi:hypothetical protein
LLTGREPEDLPHRGLALDVRAALGPSADGRLVEALERMLDPDPDRRAQTPSLSPARRPGSPGRSERAPSSSTNWQDALREGFERQAREYEERAREYEARAGLGDPVSEGWGRGAEGWRKAADKWRAAAEKHRQKAERRAARHASRFARKAARQADRFASYRGPHRHVPPWPLLFVLAMVFTIGAFAVTLATQVVVPVVLRFLAVFFARDGLTRAAEAVRDAGHEALADIQRSQQWFMRQVHDRGDPRGAPRPATESPSDAPRAGDAQVRIAEEPALPKSRVATASMDEAAADDEDVRDPAHHTRR